MPRSSLRSSQVAESGVRISSRILERYLLRGEQVEVATRQHWARLAEPVITVVLGFFAIAWISTVIAEDAVGLLWLFWFALIGRLILRLFAWRHEWFCATDKRLLLTYGLFTHKVAMMPLGKVTDINYGRSVTGRMLGYGDFTLESAGQDQALRQIDWIPAPDETYRQICHIIFGTPRFDRDDSLDSADPTRPAPTDPTRPGPTDPTRPGPDRTEPLLRSQRPSRRRLHIARQRPPVQRGATDDAHRAGNDPETHRS